VLFIFTTRRFIPEIFATKVESCQKSRSIVDIFVLSNFIGGTPCKISVQLITQTSKHLHW